MNETEIDRLERKEREFNLRRIREQDEKRQRKIENYGKMTPEKSKELNDRKGRLKKWKE